MIVYLLFLPSVFIFEVFFDRSLIFLDDKINSRSNHATMEKISLLYEQWYIIKSHNNAILLDPHVKKY